MAACRMSSVRCSVGPGDIEEMVLMDSGVGFTTTPRGRPGVRRGIDGVVIAGKLYLMSRKGSCSGREEGDAESLLKMLKKLAFFEGDVKSDWCMPIR
jgi:hypothetical protein